MINIVSKRIFFANQHFNPHRKYQSYSSLLYKNKYYFFNNGKFDLKKDYYAILGLNKTASIPDIKKQYYVLAKQYHPDVNPNAQQKFKLINEAYSILSNEKAKSEYDENRQVYQAQQKFRDRRTQYQQQYQQQYYKQYQKAYEQMNDSDRQLIKRAFIRFFARIFFFGFFLTMFFGFLSTRARVYPTDDYGRPINLYSSNHPPPPPFNDPYNLGGSPNYSQQGYGKQYVSGNQNQQNYY